MAYVLMCELWRCDVCVHNGAVVGCAVSIPSAAAVAQRLQAFGTVLFTAPDCPASQQQLDVFGGADVLKDRVKIIQCDGTPEFTEVCRRLPGTPYLVVGGSGLQGVQTLGAVHGFLESVEATAKKLKGATMFGSEGCIWTQRQKLVLGPHFEHIKYVQCDGSGMEECRTKGVKSVPTWDFAGSGSLEPGYMPLPRLRAAAGESSSL